MLLKEFQQDINDYFDNVFVDNSYLIRSQYYDEIEQKT